MKPTPFFVGLLAVIGTVSNASAAVTFLGVAAGDVSSTEATVWTRAVDEASPAAVSVTLQVSATPSFTTFSSLSSNTDATKDYTVKFDFAGLGAGTVYYYRFVGPGGVTSITGKFKTAPASSTAAPVHFAFSGDNDGLMRPYALASAIPGQNLDFFINLGDVIYENVSNVAGDNAAPWLNSPSVTLSNDSLSFNGVPRAINPSPTAAPFATRAQLLADYAKKYRENFLPVNTGGQNSLQGLYAAQGNYTTWDNHELGNRKYIDGGAPAGGSVGGPTGTDMATGRGVDARNNGAGNVGNVNDVNNSASDFMNRAPGFVALRDIFLAYQPIASRPALSTPTDPRTDGTPQIFVSRQWGRNALLINTDTRSYRDIRIKTANAAADDTTAPRANNPGRTYLGATQLAWVKQQLLQAQAAGTPWKFITISDPIDQLGPIGGALTLNGLPSFGSGSTYLPVNADGGKSYMGGYRAERNALLKWIADNQIVNVVFLATDDHQNRINELTYSPTGETENQASYVKVPYCFSIVCGPLGATGPDLITNHTFEMARDYAASIATAQSLAGIEPLGLIGYPGLRDLVREGHAAAATSPLPVDFYSPDTFNFTTLDVSADGRTLTVKSVGMTATVQNSANEYNGVTNPAHELFSFKIDTDVVPAGVQVLRGGLVFDRRTQRFAQQVRVTNNGSTALAAGSLFLVADSLSSNATLSNASGATASFAPIGSPYVQVPVTLNPGQSTTVVLEFNNPTKAAITYTPRVLTGPLAP